MLRGPEVVGALGEIAADARVDGGGGGLCAFGRPRADEDVMAGVGPAERQAGALLAGAAEHGDFRFGLRVHGFTPPARRADAARARKSTAQGLARGRMRRGARPARLGKAGVT